MPFYGGTRRVLLSAPTNVFLPNVAGRWSANLGKVNAASLPNLTINGFISAGASTPLAPFKYNTITVNQPWSAQNSTAKYCFVIWCNNLVIGANGSIQAHGADGGSNDEFFFSIGGTGGDGGSGAGGGGGASSCPIINGGAGGSGVNGQSGTDGDTGTGGSPGAGYGDLFTSAFTITGGAAEQVFCSIAAGPGNGFGGAGDGGQGGFIQCDTAYSGGGGGGGGGGITIICNSITGGHSAQMFAYGGNGGAGNNVAFQNGGAGGGGGAIEIYTNHYVANSIVPNVDGGTSDYGQAPHGNSFIYDIRTGFPVSRLFTESW